MKCAAEHDLCGKSLALQSGNVSVPPGKALTIQPSGIVNPNGHYLKCSGGTITDNGATWSPDIAVKQGSTIKGHCSAINPASSGKTVYVASGTYNEQVSMKGGVGPIGALGGSTTINVGSNGVAVTFNNADAKVSGFTLTEFVGVSIQNNGGYGVCCSGLSEPWFRLGEGNNQG